MSKEARAATMAVIAEYASLYSKRLSETDLNVMAAHMSVWPAKRLRELFDAHMASADGKFWPNPGSLRRLDVQEASPEAVHSLIMDAVHKSRYAEDKNAAVKLLLDNVCGRVYDLRGGYDYFAYMQESKYGFERNSCASVAKTMIETGSALAIEDRNDKKLIEQEKK
jgi:hypothetical protein